MGFFDLFNKKRGKKEKKSEDFDEDNGADIKRLENSIRKSRNEIYKRRLERLKEEQERILLEEEIAEAESQLAEFENQGEGDAGLDSKDFLNPDLLITTLLMNFFKKSQDAPQTPSPQPSQITQTPQKTKYTDDELRQIKAKIPGSYLKEIKSMGDDEITYVLMERFPNVDDDTIKRAVLILKEA